MSEGHGSVEFKGSGQGLAIRVHLDHDLQTLKELIRKRIDENPSFYQGATVAEISCEALSPEIRQQLVNWLVAEYRMSVSKQKKVTRETAEKKETPQPEKPPVMKSRPSQPSGTKFVQGTLRSGQRVEHPGDVVVMGDVNPGAEISAGGNIVVMGSLRGIAHAGLQGNEDAFVAALVLQPTQLRIHQTITRSPDEGSVKSHNPEVARLKDKMICVEPFLVRTRENE